MKHILRLKKLSKNNRRQMTTSQKGKQKLQVAIEKKNPKNKK